MCRQYARGSVDSFCEAFRTASGCFGVFRTFNAKAKALKEASVAHLVHWPPGHIDISDTSWPRFRLCSCALVDCRKDLRLAPAHSSGHPSAVHVGEGSAAPFKAPPRPRFHGRVAPWPIADPPRGGSLGLPNGRRATGDANFTQ
eukprot:1420260-Alexandrium_andersonii.AAC.1